ncbi:MAG: hypothetical protein M0Z59_10420 [Nitrospiraceae bacterium]|nr:hypothetical protein [Nitrospiraceae bacterium]
MGIEEKGSAGDEIVERNGLKVYMDAKTSMNLSDMEMDFVEEAEGSGFVLKGGSQPAGGNCSNCGH